jgi:hypothetical protein
VLLEGMQSFARRDALNQCLASHLNLEGPLNKYGGAFGEAIFAWQQT